MHLLNDVSILIVGLDIGQPFPVRQLEVVLLKQRTLQNGNFNSQLPVFCVSQLVSCVTLVLASLVYVGLVVWLS